MRHRDRLALGDLCCIVLGTIVAEGWFVVRAFLEVARDERARVRARALDQNGPS